MSESGVMAQINKELEADGWTNPLGGPHSFGEQRGDVVGDVGGGMVVPPHIAKLIFADIRRAAHMRRMERVKLAAWLGLQSLAAGYIFLRGGDLGTFLALLLYGASSAGVGVILNRLWWRLFSGKAPRYVARWGVERRGGGME